MNKTMSILQLRKDALSQFSTVRIAFAVSIIAIFISSCAVSPQGFATEVVEKRASFDMECNEVSTQLLGDIAYPYNGMSEMNIGVTGCGKKASYVTRCTESGKEGKRWNCTPHLNTLSCPPDSNAPNE